MPAPGLNQGGRSAGCSSSGTTALALPALLLLLLLVEVLLVVRSGEVLAGAGGGAGAVGRCKASAFLQLVSLSEDLAAGPGWPGEWSGGGFAAVPPSSVTVIFGPWRCTASCSMSPGAMTAVWSK
jgi:hypothetical protein